jgi:hypothetical protein
VAAKIATFLDIRLGQQSTRHVEGEYQLPAIAGVKLASAEFIGQHDKRLSFIGTKSGMGTPSRDNTISIAGQYNLIRKLLYRIGNIKPPRCTVGAFAWSVTLGEFVTDETVTTVDHFLLLLRFRVHLRQPPLNLRPLLGIDDKAVHP